MLIVARDQFEASCAGHMLHIADLAASWLLCYAAVASLIK